MKLLEQLPEKLLGWVGRRNSYVKVGLSIAIIWTLIAVTPGTIAILKHVEKFWINLHTPTGSPVIVAGGSIYGAVNPPKVAWLPASICSGGPSLPNMYCAPIPNGDSYSLSSIGFNATLISPTSTQSWKILFPDKNPTSPIDLQLCSNSTCTVDVGEPPDLHYVYIALTDVNNSQWENKGPMLIGNLEYLYFHDTRKGCENTSAYEGPCDVLTIARVFIAGSKEVDYTCVDPSQNYCAIGVGSPAVTLTNLVALYKKLF